MTQVCRNCNIEKCADEFGKDKRLKLGLKYFCKQCFNILYNDSRKQWKSRNSHKVKAQNKRYKDNHKKECCYRENMRRALKHKATPKWADIEKIRQIYKNCPEGFHVDHIIPLKGKDICGLHIETNLQYLPASENIRKSNKF